MLFLSVLCHTVDFTVLALLSRTVLSCYPCSQLLAQVEVNSMDEHSFVTLQWETIHTNLSGIAVLNFEIANLFKLESSIHSSIHSLFWKKLKEVILACH